MSFDKSVSTHKLKKERKHLGLIHVRKAHKYTVYYNCYNIADSIANTEAKYVIVFLILDIFSKLKKKIFTSENINNTIMNKHVWLYIPGCYKGKEYENRTSLYIV